MDPSDLSLLLPAMAIIFFAGLAQAITGFGFGLVAVPLLTLFLSPKDAIPIVSLEGLAVNFLILYRGMKYADLGRVRLLLGASLLGVPVGVWMLSALDADTLRLYIGVIMLLAGTAFMTGFRRRFEREQLASAPVGFSSGVLAGSISMPGPPIILFFTNQDIAREVFRTNLVLVVTLQLFLILPIYAARDLLPVDSLASAGLILPALLLGGLAGTYLSHHISDSLFQRLTLVTVIVAGLISILTGAGLI